MMKSETRMGTSEPLAAPSSKEIDRLGRVPDRLLLDGLNGPTALHEEVLVVDDRAGLSPAQAVENKLSRMLRETSLPVSHLQMRGMLRAR